MLIPGRTREARASVRAQGRLRLSRLNTRTSCPDAFLSTSYGYGGGIDWVGRRVLATDPPIILTFPFLISNDTSTRCRSARSHPSDPGIQVLRRVIIEKSAEANTIKMPAKSNATLEELADR